MAKKTFFLLALFITLIVKSVNNVNAQGLYNDGPWDPKTDVTTMDTYKKAIEKDNCATPSLECLVHQTFQFVSIEQVNSILYPNGSPAQVVGDNGSTKAISLKQRGAIGGMTFLIGEMYRYPAARTSVFVADVLKNARIISPAYAQGLGFASLNPILELWKVFRNVAYMLFILVFIVLGFLIMFRQKISGQTAVTAQQAIPSVITSLIFVTFSYAIAGFLIDMMYLSMFMIMGIFGKTSGLSANIIDFNIFNLMKELFGSVSGFGKNIDIVTNILNSLTNNDSSFINNVAGGIGGITLALILAVAILIGTFKLFFELLKSYATIVLSVVVSPLILIGGAFPGKNTFGPWIKNLVANLAAFPTVLIVMILFYQFTDKATGANTTGGFIPPFLIGRGQQGAIATLMGLAIILALPEIVKEVKKKLGATEGFGTMVFNSAWNRSKESLPVAGRIGAIGLGSIAGAGGFANKFIKSKGGLRERIAQGVGKYNHETGEGYGFKKAFFPVARKATEATSAFTRSIGARQPDVLNLLTKKIDTKIAPKVATKEEKIQAVEDIVDAFVKKRV